MSAQPKTYRPDIDGLRAIAVLGVVLFHAGVRPLAGGYVGVDIFFVISGYLITTILAADRRAGRLSIAAFYHRRIRRIFPALFVMAATCVVIAAPIFLPTDFAAFGRSLVAMALFSSNVYFEATREAAGYFDVASQTQLLLHTWSLAVEEQFYIVLPLGLVLLRRCSDATVVRCLAIIAAISFAYSVWACAAWPADAFYDVASRAWELLLGSLLALRAPPKLASRVSREISAGLGMAMIAFAMLRYSEATMFPGAAALLPCIGAALLIHAGGSGATLVGRALSSRVAVAIGLVSYSLYLWHWPIIVFVRYVSAGVMETPQRVLCIALSFAVAGLSYRFVETPFRHANPKVSRRVVIASGFATSLVAMAVGLVIVVGGGLPSRFDAGTLTRVAENLHRMSEIPAGNCDNWGKTLRSPSEFVFCSVGKDGPHKVLVWGDSHADELRPLIGRLADEKALDDRGVVFAVAAGCPPVRNLRPTGPAQCDLYAKWALERAEAKDVDTVLVVFATWWERYDRLLCISKDGVCRQPLLRADAEDAFLADLRASLKQLKGDGKRVVLTLPLPLYNVSIPRAEIETAVMPGVDRFMRATGLINVVRYDYAPLRQRLINLANDLDIATFDPRKRLCTGDDCKYAENGISLYVDHGHIASSQLGLFHDDLRAVLQTPTNAGAFHVAAESK